MESMLWVGAAWLALSAPVALAIGGCIRVGTACGEETPPAEDQRAPLAA